MSTDGTMSLWEQRVSVVYSDNPVQKDLIQDIRNSGSQWIDFLAKHKDERPDMDGEIARVYAHAMTVIEDAVMWSIKAITK